MICLVWFPVAVIKHGLNPRKVGKRLYSLQIVHNHEGTWRERTKQRALRSGSYWLGPLASSASSLIQPRPGYPRMVRPTVFYEFLHQLARKKMPHTHAHRAMEAVPQLRYFLSGISGLVSS